MSKDTKDIITTFVIALLSTVTGGVFFCVYLLYKYLREEC